MQHLVMQLRLGGSVVDVVQFLLISHCIRGNKKPGSWEPPARARRNVGITSRGAESFCLPFPHLLHVWQCKLSGRATTDWGTKKTNIKEICLWFGKLWPRLEAAANINSGLW